MDFVPGLRGAAGLPAEGPAWRLRRVHAPYWTWRGDKRSAELTVVRQLARELRRDDRDDIRSVRSLRDDPPDCEGLDARGARVAFEVCELVDQVAAARGQRGEPASKHWRPAEVLAAIEHILRVKGGVRYDRHRYRRVALVICTGEGELDFERYGTLLAAVRWPPTYSLDDAYLIFAPSPRWDRCPYVHLQTARLGPPAPHRVLGGLS